MGCLSHACRIPLLTACTVIGLALLFTTAARADLGPAPQGTFTIAVIPDTQLYTGKGTKAEPESDAPVTNAVFEAYTSWIADNLAAQRIAFVSHVGDIVDKNEPAQWIVARRAMSRIHGRVPYGLSVGNHDMQPSGDSSLFQAAFPRARYRNMPWYGGSFEPPDRGFWSGNNANSYQLFSAGDYRFVFLHLECNAPDRVLDWAGRVLHEHEGRVAFITTHMGLGPLQFPENIETFRLAPRGLMQWTKCHGDNGNSSQQLWDKLFRKHRNLHAVFSGDQSRLQSMYEARQGDAGNIVHFFMSDYGRQGIRLYRFAPDRHVLEVITFNPVRSKLTERTTIVPDRGRHQFRVRLTLD